MTVLASALLLWCPQHPDCICWSTGPGAADGQALCSADQLPHPQPLTFSLLVPSNVRLVEVLDTSQRDPCLHGFLIPFPLSASNLGVCSASYSSPDVSSSLIGQMLFGSVPRTTSTHVSRHWQNSVQLPV